MSGDPEARVTLYVCACGSKSTSPRLCMHIGLDLHHSPERQMQPVEYVPLSELQQREAQVVRTATRDSERIEALRWAIADIRSWCADLGDSTLTAGEIGEQVRKMCDDALIPRAKAVR